MSAVRLSHPTVTKRIKPYPPVMRCKSVKEGIFMSKQEKRNKIPLFKSLKFLCLAAMLTAMSVVIGMFCKTALNFGDGLFRVTFENLPIIFSGVFLGPIAGALTGIASDLISYLLSPQTYPPNLIVTAGAAFVGFVAGLVAKFAVRQRGCLQFIVAGGVAHIVGSMIIKPIGLYQFYGWLVLWRIPMYLVIAPVEIAVLCMLYKNKSFRRMIDGFLGGVSKN